VNRRQLASVGETAKHIGQDAATVRRWIQAGCPVVRPGRRGPGNGAILDLQEVQKWLDARRGPRQEPNPDEILQRIAAVLWQGLNQDHVALRAGISRADAAACLVAVFDSCCESFGYRYQFNTLPEPIRALMREL